MDFFFFGVLFLFHSVIRMGPFGSTGFVKAFSLGYLGTLDSLVLLEGFVIVGCVGGGFANFLWCV